MREHLRAGIAVFNAGDFHDAHDAWEDRWLDLESGTDDERLLHGLIQFTAAVHHGYGRNWAGCVGLVESAEEYLSGLPDEYRGIDVGRVRRVLAEIARDPEVLYRRGAPLLTHEGTHVRLADLDFTAAAVAAGVYAEREGYDEETIDSGITYAREDLADGRENSRFVHLVRDFAADPANRGIIHQRLAGHVDQRRHRERDVEGLFD
ncbi:DUF309 domain-containing protein [Haloarchaeobius litoreus]|uniref:DUF309 domain-containing protein n=1 Tax=Haloarchaeobius litoreus TaxID=755306 RepID=A0ABD6DDJ1_9EURY|nr:DUF309 domain-containing protein [Haloarchaeobius litoreus]